MDREQIVMLVLLLVVPAICAGLLLLFTDLLPSEAGGVGSMIGVVLAVWWAMR